MGREFYYKMGDIVLASNPNARGSVQGGQRPFLIVSNNIANKYSPTYSVIPFTSGKRYKMYQPTHCIYEAGEGGLHVQSVLLGEQVTTISKDDVSTFVGHFNDEQMERAAEAIIFQMPFLTQGVSMCTNNPRFQSVASSM